MWEENGRDLNNDSRFESDFADCVHVWGGSQVRRTTPVCARSVRKCEKTLKYNIARTQCNYKCCQVTKHLLVVVMVVVVVIVIVQHIGKLPKRLLLPVIVIVIVIVVVIVIVNIVQHIDKLPNRVFLPIIVIVIVIFDVILVIIV